MLQISASTVVFVCTQPVDFRKGIDGLATACRNKLEQDPFQGAIFVFHNLKKQQFVFWFMTDRDFGFAQNDFRKELFDGGHQIQ